MASESSPLRSQIFDEHASFVRRLAKSLVRDENRADDVAQATWLAALESPPSHEGGLRGWFASIARNLARKSGRSEQRREYRERSVARGETTPSIVDTLARQSVLRQVTDAVLDLEEPYRTTVMLSFYEGLSVNEIADELREPEATIRSRKRRALEKLRERLDRENDGGRNAWCSALVSLVAARKWAESAALASATAASTATIGEVLLMSMKLKLIGGGALACVAALALWKALPRDEVESDTFAAIAPTEVELAGDTAALDETSDEAATTEREELAATGEAELESAITTPYAALTIRVTWEANGEPVPDEPVQLLNWSAAPGERMRLVRTDAEGKVRLDPLLPGSMNVSPAHGGGARIELVAGDDSELDLTVPIGFTARGVVHDENDQPVSGARVWLSEYFNYHDGSYLATTDLNGRFEIEHVGEARYIGAVADGHSPTHLHFLPDARGGASLDTPTELVLALTGEGGVLRGVVRMPDGKPAKSTFVAVEGAWPRAVTSQNGDRLWYAPTCQLMTDGAGAFEVRGLAVGQAKLRVLGAGCSAYDGTATIEAGRTTNVEVDLSPSCVVFGTVTLPSGEPAVDATVRQDIQYDPGNPSSRTDEKGRFRVEGLPPGPVGLFVEVKEVGRVEADFDLQPGEEAEWNARIDAGRVVAGRVLDEEGQPIVGWTASARIPNEFGNPRPWSQRAETDDEGRFVIVECPDVEFELRIFAPENRIQAVVTSAIAPDQREVELLVESRARPTAGLEGTLIGPDGLPIGGSFHAWLDGEGRADDHPNDAETGEFTIENRRPGRYLLYVRPTDMPYHCVGEYELEPHEMLDVGRIELAAPGRLALTVDGEKSFDPYNSIQITPIAGGLARRLATHSWNGGDAISEFVLMPGRYRLRAMSGSAATAFEDFEVHAGQDTLVDLSPRGGVSVVVHFAFAEGVEVELDGFEAELSGPDGVVPEEVMVHEGRLFPMYVRLEPGRYVVRAKTVDGWAGTHEFEVTTGASEQQKIVVVMGN